TSLEFCVDDFLEIEARLNGVYVHEQLLTGKYLCEPINQASGRMPTIITPVADKNPPAHGTLPLQRSTLTPLPRRINVGRVYNTQTARTSSVGATIAAN